MGSGGQDQQCRRANPPVPARFRQLRTWPRNPRPSLRLGINWYLTPNIKWQFDYANTYFDGGAGVKAAPKDRPNESVFESQLQISFGS